jgi:hypothetical protein
MTLKEKTAFGFFCILVVVLCALVSFKFQHELVSQNRAMIEARKQYCAEHQKECE